MTTSAPLRRPSAAMATVVALLFFFTGASGLIYQVVWQRYLLNIFGATIYSVATVLAAFMGGLALGSLLFSRLAERTRSPLSVYGYIEIGIGAIALVVPALLRLLDPLFQVAYDSLGSNFLAFSLARFVLVGGILLIPTTLMGGTLPLLARFASPTGEGAGLRVGILYAINTLGAVAGCFFSGYFIIRLVGVYNTVIIAAVLNIAAGVISLGLAKVSSRESAAPPPVPGSPENPETSANLAALRAIFLAYAVSGFAALSLEVAWTRGLVFSFDLLKNTTYAFTAMLTTFLIGIAAGSAIMSLFAERLREPYRVFAGLQVLIGISAILSFFVLFYRAPLVGETWFHEAEATSRGIRWWSSVALVFLRTFVTMGLPTFCMGLAFPVAVRAAIAAGGGTASTVGRLYAFNTLGAIAGSFATGFVLLPVLGIAATILTVASLQMAAGIYLALRDKSLPTSTRYGWLVVGVLTIVVAVVRLPKSLAFQRVSEIEAVVFYKEGPLATVSVVENSLGFRTINVDNVGVAGTDPILLTDQKSLAHVPMLLLEKPRSALTVGFGSGGASYSYTLYDELERIDCVEITKTVIEASPALVDSHHNVVFRKGTPGYDAAKSPIPLWNDGGASGWFKTDPRYNVILDDARSYLHFTRHRYDIIATDCTDLRYKSNANLYDLEYFQLTRDRITDDGMVVVWMPLAGLSEDAMKVAFRTFYKVFPDMEVFFMNNAPTHYVLLIGTRERVRVRPELMKQRLADPDVARDLAEIHLASAEKILSCYVTGREKLGQYLGDGPLNTPDFPYLEFESPRYGYGDDALLDNLDALYAVAEKPETLLVESAPADFRASLDRFMNAVPEIISGHRDYRQMRLVQAAERYKAALERNPDDPSVQHLLGFDELRRRVAGRPNDLWARYYLGVLSTISGRDRDAVTQFNELVRRYDSLPARYPQDTVFLRDAYLRLAEIYDRNNQPDRAAESRAKADAVEVPK